LLLSPKHTFFRLPRRPKKGRVLRTAKGKGLAEQTAEKVAPTPAMEKKRKMKKEKKGSNNSKAGGGMDFVERGKEEEPCLKRHWGPKNKKKKPRAVRNVIKVGRRQKKNLLAHAASGEKEIGEIEKSSLGPKDNHLCRVQREKESSCRSCKGKKKGPKMRSPFEPEKV